MARNIHRKIRVALSSFVLAVLAFALMTYVVQGRPAGSGTRLFGAAVQAEQSSQGGSLGADEEQDALQALIEHADHDEEHRRAVAEGAHSWAHVGPVTMRGDPPASAKIS